LRHGELLAVHFTWITMILDDGVEMKRDGLTKPLKVLLDGVLSLLSLLSMYGRGTLDQRKDVSSGSLACVTDL
jgi:hypothetical protein